MNTSLLFVLLCAGAVHAQEIRQPIDQKTPVSSDQVERRELTQLALSEDRHARTYFDTDATGAAWVRGRGYKARFDAAGATVFPFLGSDAPALYPVHWALSSASVGGVAIELAPAEKAVRTDATITIDRGVIDERYDVGVENIEQSFVIEALPAPGDLHLRVSVQTELAASVRANEFVFANERGGVRYGHASVLSARGEKVAVETTLVDGTIRIDVPATLVQAIGLPLVVDPLISVFAIDVYQDQFVPDVAYDATNDVYLVVEEEKFATVDDDVYTIRVSPAGLNVGAAYADLTTADWQTPRVANLNAYDQFLVVASIQDPSVAFGQRYIGGRTTPAASPLSFSATIPISDTTVFGTMVNPDVGGDPYASAPAYYCVTWQWDTVLFPQTNEIVYRMVSGAGATVGSTIGLSSGSQDKTPAIANGNGGLVWTIAWTRDINAPVDVDVHAARVDWSGVLVSPAFTVENQRAGIEHPSVASPFDTGDCAVAFGFISVQQGYPTVGARVLTGTSVGPLQDLGPTQFTWDIFSPAVDCDGRYLVVAMEVRFDPWLPTTPREHRLRSFFLSGGNLVEAETLWVENGPDDTRNASVCAARSTGGPTVHFLAVHDRKPAASGRSVWGALYDTWVGGPITTVCAGDGSFWTCPCSNNGSSGHGCANASDAAGGLLSGTGAASVASDSLLLTVTSIPNGGCLFFQATSTSFGSAFGDGVLCVSGSILRLGVNIAAGGTTSFPTSGGSSISLTGAVPAPGGERIYQGWYRDNASFCTSAVFNLTNALKVTWFP